MFRENRTQQAYIFERGANLTERERRYLGKSWAEDFAANIFPHINEQRFAPLYNSENGRPNTPINVMVGALIIKEMFGYTDDEMMDHMLFNIQVQHALRLTSEIEIPFSDRTLSRFREALLKHEAETGQDLLKEEVLALSLFAKDLLGVGDRVRRMDSIMISSRCKKIGRLELVYTCVEALAAEYVKRNGALPLPEWLMKYTQKSNKNATIYRAKPEEVGARLESAVADAIALKALCGDGFGDCPAYSLLSRMLDDQTEGGKLKDGKDVEPTSLQNPSDPDATFRRKAGKKHTGYVGNIVESCGDGVGVITDYDLQPNTHSDQEFAKDVISRSDGAEVGSALICDGAYGSEDNFDEAAEKSINLVPTCLTGKPANVTLVDFHIDGDLIIGCPYGHAPTAASYDEETRTLEATFDGTVCAGCPLFGTCPAKQRKDGSATVSFTDTSYNRSLYERQLGTEEYKEYARKRNGVEGVMSILRRKYCVDAMPVFGQKKSGLLFGIKVAAVNAVTLIKNLQTKRKEKEKSTGEVCPA